MTAYPHRDWPKQALLHPEPPISWRTRITWAAIGAAVAFVVGVVW